MSVLSLDRNYGCRINDEYTFHGLRVVVLENEYLRLSVLADKGTDIFEFLYKPLDVDFMAVSPMGLRNPNQGLPTNAHSSGFLHDYWEGGWMECFPNGGNPANYNGVEFGQHGEIHLLPWRHAVLEDSPERISVKFWVRTYRTPFLVEKTLTLERRRPVLLIQERVTNESEVPVDYMWGHHPVFGWPFLEPGCTIDVPRCRAQVHGEIYSPDNTLKPGAEFTWPYAPTQSGATADLSLTPALDVQSENLVYLSDLESGWYAVTNPRQGVGLAMVWPTQVFPYLSLWQEYHGGPTYLWYRRQYSLGAEPWSSIPVSGLVKALERGTACRLEGRASTTLEMRVVAYPGVQRIRCVEPDGAVIFK
jgi:hypothetical protein